MIRPRVLPQPTVMLTTARIIIVFLAILAACSDDPTSPVGADARVYRLETVNGKPLPLYVAPPGSSATIYRSDLLLRADGTFGLGVEGQNGFFFTGTYTDSAGKLFLVSSPAGPEWPRSGVLAGDSLVMVNQSTFVYRRIALLRPFVESTRYQLRIINGRGEPLTWHDTTLADGRYVTRIPFDSLDFEPFFYRRHRSELFLWYRPDGNVESTLREGVEIGSYEVNASFVVLRRYVIPSASTILDSLEIDGTELVRRTLLNPGVVEERYRRSP